MSIFRKGILERELCEVVYDRAKSIVYNDNESPDETAVRFNCDIKKDVAAWEDRYRNLMLRRASINDVIRFADEYGCTVDYLLGRTEHPYMNTNI